MASTKLLADVFKPVRKLGEGGMGIVHEVIADSDAPGYVGFLADTIAWREATGEQAAELSQMTGTVISTKATIDGLIADEIEFQDQRKSHETAREGRGRTQRRQTRRVCCNADASQDTAWHVNVTLQPMGGELRRRLPNPRRFFTHIPATRDHHSGNKRPSLPASV